MASYKALMAISDSQTKSAQSTVQAVLAARKAKEAQRRKAQEEQERKQRELDAQLRQRHFEELEKAKQAEIKAAAEREKKEAELRRREAAQRDALMYGPKKAAARAGGSKWPSSTSGVRDEVRKKRFPEDEDEEPDSGPGSMLTREEKRERKLQAALKRTFNATRKGTHYSGGTRRAGRTMPGGAVDMPTPSADALSAKTHGSVKERLASIPNTLTRLNVVKRDTRTIDEIVRDRREGKDVLDGDRARGFDDWFTPATKRDRFTPPTRPYSSQPLPATTTTSVKPQQRAPAPTPTPATKVRPTTKLALPSAAASNGSSSSQKKRPRSLSLSRSISPPPPKRLHVPVASSSALAKSSSYKASSSTASSAKAKSTSSRSRSPHGHGHGHGGHAAGSSLSDEIWSLFGKSKAAYVARDVLSDSEDDGDMEAGADAVEQEERWSERVARREEREAEAEEKRREEEKRRRKAAAAAAAR